MKKRKLSVSDGLILISALLISSDESGRFLLLGISALIHELGHIACICMFSKRIDSIRLTLTGADIRYGGGRGGYFADIAIALAGPLANAAASLTSRLVTGQGLYYFIGVNLALCLFNLLPIYPLDGGRALLLLLEWSLSPDRAWRVSSVISFIISFALAAAALRGALAGIALWPLWIFSALLFMQVRELAPCVPASARDLFNIKRPPLRGRQA